MRNPDNPPSDPKRNGAEKCRCNDHPVNEVRKRVPGESDTPWSRERLERPRVPVFRLYDIDERPHGAEHLNHQPIKSPPLFFEGYHFARGVFVQMLSRGHRRLPQ